MGRAKLRMELIPKEKTRNTTFHKRKHGIIKKANEFSILCDVDTVVIIYPPNSNSPEVWPENAEKIKKTIACYKAKKGEAGKRSFDLNDFFQERKKKIEEELAKARKRNMEAKYPTWFDELDRCNEAQLRRFAMQLENRENVVRAQLEFKKRNMNVQLPYMFADMGSGSGVDYGQHPNRYVTSRDQGGWFGGDAGLMGSSSYVPLVRRDDQKMGFGYPAYDSGSQWGYGYHAQVAHGSVMQGVGKQENNESEVMSNGGGVGDFVMHYHGGRFYG